EVHRYGAVLEGAGPVDSMELAVIHLDAAIVEVGGVDQVLRAIAADGQALVYRTLRGMIQRQHGVLQVHGLRPAADRSVFTREQEHARAREPAFRDHEIRRAVVHDARRVTQTVFSDRGVWNGHHQRLRRAGAVVQRGHSGAVVRNPYKGIWIEYQSPRVDEL